MNTAQNTENTENSVALETTSLDSTRSETSTPENTTSENTVAGATRSVRTLRPAVDILEGETGFRLLVDLPGVAPEDLSVDFENSTITVAGLRHLGRTAPDGSRLAVTYQRAFDLPDTVDADGIAAALDNGLLTLDLPRSAAATPRRIPINVG